MVTKTFLPSNLCDISESSESSENSDSCDNSDISDSSDSSDQNKSKKTFFKFIFTLFPPKKISPKTQTQIVMKLKNSNCDQIQKLKLR